MTTRRILIAGNWKLNKSIAEAKTFTQDLAQALPSLTKVEVVIAPTFTALASLDAITQSSPIQLSAQDVYWQDSGAFTGELSPSLLRDAGCSWCIVGHSERRQLFAETDAWVAKKAEALLRHGLKPIICVGETLEQRQQGSTLQVITQQLSAVLTDLPLDLGSFAIAYEPVWAIGTGKTASAQDAQDVHGNIRELLHKHCGDRANTTQVLYGGSVKPDNVRHLLEQPDIDGALIGGASLNLDSFLAIIQTAIELGEN